MPVAPGEYPDVQIAVCDVSKASVRWPIVAGDVVLHRRDGVLHPMQLAVHRLVMRLLIQVG
ncbi:MAG TPA: hypothetical protein VMG63_20460 [Terriglobia bacterium]|nr:hypothetical protein [Terriglobia bacterium]